MANFNIVPRSVRTAQKLYLSAVSLWAVEALLFSKSGETVVFMAVVCCAAIGVIVKFRDGKNWARIILLLITVFSVLTSVPLLAGSKIMATASASFELITTTLMVVASIFAISGESSGWF